MNGYAREKSNRIKEGSSVATVILYFVATFVFLICLYPMYYVLILSLSEPVAAATMKVYLFPKNLSLASYSLIVNDPEIWRAYLNTILYIVPTTLIMMLTCILAAYPLTVKGLKLRKLINTYLLIPMYFSGGMIPSFLLIVRLGLYDSPLSQILPCCYSIWYIILTKSYLSSIPESLREAAKIDGANVYQILFKVYLPLSTPILAVIAVYTVVNVWNSWFNASIYLPHTKWQPLQLYLRRVLIENTKTVQDLMDADEAKAQAMRRLSNAQLKYALIIFTTLPVICVYPFFQKYFIKGIMLGSLKE